MFSGLLVGSDPWVNMMDIVSLIETGSASLPYLVAVGVLLGALHGLEPGHSKTMMAAFIIAVRGTPLQALLLGLSAAASHSVVVWILVLIALSFGDALIGERMEPYFVAVSGAVVLVIGAVMLFRALRARESYIHSHDKHGTGGEEDHLDTHAAAHARDIEKRFSGGRATLAQTIGFGLVGGLIPCPAAITVMLLCLGIDRAWLGIGMVASFSAGLALTMVGVGMGAAISLRYATRKSAKLDRFLNAAPYVSGGVIFTVGTLMAWSGLARIV